MISVGCQKSNTNNDCGCNSPTIETISEWKGYLLFNTTENRYEIQTGAVGGHSDYFICNPSFVKSQLDIDTTEKISYSVIFSGVVKKFCTDNTLIYIDNPHYNVNLNKIQLTNSKQEE